MTVNQVLFLNTVADKLAQRFFAFHFAAPVSLLGSNPELLKQPPPPSPFSALFYRIAALLVLVFPSSIGTIPIIKSPDIVLTTHGLQALILSLNPNKSQSFSKQNWRVREKGRRKERRMRGKKNRCS